MYMLVRGEKGEWEWRKSERERKGEEDNLSVDLILRYLPHLGLGQAEARSQELSLRLLCE